MAFKPAATRTTQGWSRRERLWCVCTCTEGGGRLCWDPIEGATGLAMPGKEPKGKPIYIFSKSQRKLQGFQRKLPELLQEQVREQQQARWVTLQMLRAGSSARKNWDHWTHRMVLVSSLTSYVGPFLHDRLHPRPTSRVLEEDSFLLHHWFSQYYLLLFHFRFFSIVQDFSEVCFLFKGVTITFMTLNNYITQG